METNKHYLELTRDELEVLQSAFEVLASPHGSGVYTMLRLPELVALHQSIAKKTTVALFGREKR